MWLTTKELASKWRPAFEKGEMNFNNDAGQIAYGFSALGSGAAVEILMKDLYATNVTAEKRAGLVPLICYSADAGQMGRLASGAAQNKDAATLQTLLTISRTRKIAPPVNAVEFAPLTESDDPVLRHAALQAIGEWNIAGLKPRLEALAANKSADIADLTAAFAGIAMSNDEQLIGLLEATGKSSDLTVEVCSLALERLATARPQKAAPLIADLATALPEGGSAMNVARALLSKRWEGEAPAEPCVFANHRLGRSLALSRINFQFATTKIRDCTRDCGQIGKPVDDELPAGDAYGSGQLFFPLRRLHEKVRSHDMFDPLFVGFWCGFIGFFRPVSSGQCCYRLG